MDSGRSNRIAHLLRQLPHSQVGGPELLALTLRVGLAIGVILAKEAVPALRLCLRPHTPKLFQVELGARRLALVAHVPRPLKVEGPRLRAALAADHNPVEGLAPPCPRATRTPFGLPPASESVEPSLALALLVWT